MITESVFNSKVEEAVLKRQWAIECAGVYGRKIQSKRCAMRRFLNTATEVDKWTDTARLLQSGRAQ